MNPASIGIAITVTLLLGAFWRRMKEPIDSPPTPARPAPSPHSAAGARSHGDIRELLRQQGRESLQARLQAAGMALQLELPTEPLPVLLDRSGMQEVFAQIAEMACRVMPKGSTLRVLGRIDGIHAVVNFMDRSPSDDAPRLARCFDGRDASAGAALCAQIVSDHRGRIYAAPSPLGSLGVTLRLPLPSRSHQFSPRSPRTVGGAHFAQEIADAEELIPD